MNAPKPRRQSPRDWSAADEARLRELYATRTRNQCAEILGRSVNAIHGKVQKLGLHKRARTLWTSTEDAQLRALYPDLSTSEVAKRLGRSVESINGRVAKLNLHKSAAHLASARKACGLQVAALGTGRFHKGQTPANKGLRRPGWSPGRMRETQFKKGQRPPNTVPVGTVKMNADGYLRIKVSDEPEPPGKKGANSSNWEFVHRRVWEAAHGPVPEGHRIWWKDKDRTNNALENLELLSDKEHMARTTIHNLPPDLKQACQAVGALRRAITMKTRRGNGEKQIAGRAGSPVRDAGAAHG